VKLALGSLARILHIKIVIGPTGKIYMKKAIIVIVVLCLVMAAGAYFVFYPPFAKKLVAEQMLPTETLATIRVEHFKQSIDKFRSSRLGTAIAGIDTRYVLTALEAPATAIQEAEEFIMQVNDTLDSPWFDALFGQQVTLALLPTTIHDFNNPSPEELSQALVIVLRPKHPAKLLDWLKQMITRDIEVTSENYNQWEINSFEVEAGVKVHYAVTDGLVVLALHRRPIVRCLETLKEPAVSLAQNPDYLAVESEFKDKSELKVYGFLNLQEAYRLGSDIVSKNIDDRPEYKLIEDQISKMGGFYAAGYAAYDDGSPLLQKKMVFMVDRAALEAQYSRALDIEPETGAMLTMLPKSTLGFTWQNTLDLKLYYDSLIESEDLKPEDIASANAVVQGSFGVSIEDLVNSFGPQWGLALQSIKTGGFFPIPELGIFIQSSNPDLADQIIRQAAGKSDMPFLQENYGSHEITYLQLPFGSDLSPGYTYINGYCILAVNTKIIKSYIDTIDSGQNVTQSDSFKAIDKGLTAKNNQLAYIKFDRLMDTVPEIMRWGSSMASMAKPDNAGQFALVAEQVVNPLVDGLKMFKTVGLRSFIAETKIESQIYTEVENVKSN
jgi:hypothetical protein